MAVWSQRSPERGWLHRGRLRDIVVVLGVGSAWFCPVGFATLCLAFALLAAGAGLHVLVKGQLIRNVTLCTEGAYSVVRHPYYLANYVIDTSFCVLSGNVWLLAAYPFLFFWAYGPTLREEEDRLAALHGERLTAYRASVPEVFPDRTFWTRRSALAAGFSWRRVTLDEWKRLFRFAHVGALMALIHHIRAEGISRLAFWQHAPARPTIALAVVCVVLLLASLVIPRRCQIEPAAQAQT